ncbi:MAG TPA: (deoxy)nucleoside triphosphate pyrophosphohydrolase [Kofleriaceae bacterium]|nr:(deoxy)nucleoside triphosphate pyrophosphohydrolase [Kofleriaceae bacterium]
MDASSSPPPLPRKLVVAGLVVDDSGLVLITQRRADQALGGLWEFPGGKIEAGEAPADALHRELTEELGASVDVGQIWDVLHHIYPTFELLMLVFRCRLRAGETARTVEVADLLWVPVVELPRHDILPADRPLVDRLVVEGPPAWRAR